MKLTTVVASVNDNPNYYLFIPKQILFWKKINIKFIAIFVGKQIPDEILSYANNIILWNNNLDLNTSFVAQHLRIYFPALLNLPNDEMVMITDMDMLPTNSNYYCNNLENFSVNDFIYYRHIDGNQIYMCYNAAHPSTWKKVFNINSEEDIKNRINSTYNTSYNGVPGSNGWFIDQEIMYTMLIQYPHLKVLNRPIKRLETWDLIKNMNIADKKFISSYDDVHFHRSFNNNRDLILFVENKII
jgi:hypothetical protein